MQLITVWYYSKAKTLRILLSLLRLHSASSIQIPQSTNRYNSTLPTVYVSPLKLYSASKINLHGISGSSLFRNHFKVRISPVKSPVLRNYRSNYRRSVMYDILLFRSAMPRGVAVLKIYVVNRLSNLTLMVNDFL